MDAGQRGSLLHRVLEKFIGKHLGEKLQESQHAELQKELDEIFDTVCQEFADKGGLYPGDFWQHDKEQQRLLLHSARPAAGQHRPRSRRSENHNDGRVLTVSRPSDGGQSINM